MTTAQTTPPATGGGLSFIEQLQNSSNRPCSNPRVPYLTGVNHSDGVAVLTRGACKKWSCPSCAAREGQKWIARVLDALNNEYAELGWVFLTVTAPAWADDRETSVAQLRKGWKRMYNRFRYYFGASPYVRVYEPHSKVDEDTGEYLAREDVRFHMHMLVTYPITGVETGVYEPFGKRDKGGAKRLKDLAVECGLGHQILAREVDNAGQVAGYIAKYLVKHLTEPYLYPDSMRRIEVSRGFPKLRKLGSDYDWMLNETRDGQDETARKLHVMEGTRIVDLRPTPIQEAAALDLS